MNKITQTCKALVKEHPATLFIVFSGVIILYLIFFKEVPYLFQAHASKNWPITTGEIIRSEVINVFTRKEKELKFTYDIEYSYTADEEEHINDAIFFYGGKGTYFDFVSRRKAERLVRKYSEHTFLDVYYHPNNPGISVIEPGLHNYNYFWPGLGCLYIFFAFYVAYHSFRPYFLMENHN